MSLGPYTYITLALEPSTTPHVGVSFHTGDLEARASMIQDTRPYLDLYSVEARVTISTTGSGPVTEQDVTVARRIFDAAARYLADCERLAPKDAPDTGS